MINVLLYCPLPQVFDFDLLTTPLFPSSSLPRVRHHQRHRARLQRHLRGFGLHHGHQHDRLALLRLLSRDVLHLSLPLHHLLIDDVVLVLIVPFLIMFFFFVFYSCIFFSSIFFSSIVYSAIIYSCIFFSSIFYSSIFYSCIFYSCIFYSCIFYSAIFYSAIFYSCIFYSCIFYSAIIYSAIIYSSNLWETRASSSRSLSSSTSPRKASPRGASRTACSSSTPRAFTLWELVFDGASLLTIPLQEAASAACGAEVPQHLHRHNGSHHAALHSLCDLQLPLLRL